MASTQPIVSTSEYDENIDDYFSRSTKDNFQQQTFLYPEQQQQPLSSSKTKSTKTKPRKNKRSGKILIVDRFFFFLIN